MSNKPSFIDLLEEYLNLREADAQLNSVVEITEMPEFASLLRQRRDVVASELNNMFESLGV
jgi:hypothetical protein